MSTELTVNTEILLQVMDLLKEAIYLTNKEEQVIYVNHAAEVLEHLSKEEMIGKTISEIYSHTELREDINAPSLSVLHTGIPRKDENIGWFTKTGLEINAITSSYPIIQKNNVNGVISISENIEEQRLRLKNLGTFQRKNTFRLRKKLMKNDTTFIFDDIIGESDAMKETIAMAKRFAEKKMPIMIYGETGTGKEMIAQSIHNASRFVNGKFVPINCAAIPETLLESMLFGTVKGAFTGATDNPGLFEQAEKGTIFLDEINSMPITLQAKLLRVLQEKEIRRIGDSKIKKINCRIISATNKKPTDVIENGQLREDLFYRLSTGMIFVPNLRERGHDIELLTNYFIESCKEELTTSISGVSDSLWALLRSYQWPGNIRELSNTIESAMNMAYEDEETLDIKHIPSYLKNIYKNRIAEMPDAAQVFTYPSENKTDYQGFYPSSTNKKLKDMVGEYEKNIIIKVLGVHNGNQTKAGEELGLTRQGLALKIEKYGIDVNKYKRKK